MHPTNPLQLRFDAFELDEADARLTRGGQPVALPPKAALILAGRWSEAQQHLDDALVLAQRIGERLYLPHLLLLEARVALGQRQPDDARAAMEAALAEARAAGPLVGIERARGAMRAG